MKSFCAIALSACLSACTAAVKPGTGTASGGSPNDGFELVVLSTTDVHGRIRGWDYYSDSAESARGLARAATIVDSVRSANPGRVILLDAGDLLQGNPFAYVAMKQFADSANPIIAVMNAIRYDAMAIGNHEYNYGVPYLERAAAQARFPMLSANTYRPDGSHAFRPWTILERQGVKIGVVGATTPGVMIWDAENVRGRLRLGDIVPAVRTAVQEARASGAQIMIVTAHTGLDGPASYDTAATGLPSENVAGRVAREIPGIDLIVYGHSHQEQKNLHIGSTLLVQPKNWATSVGVAHLHLARGEAGRWSVKSSLGETIQAAGHAEQTAVLTASANTHRATVTYANTVIGSTPVAWRGDSARLKDTPIIDLILEVERKAAGTDLASTAAFTLDASLDAGPITVAEMARLYPYDNTLRAVKISGRELRDYLEYSSRFYAGGGSGSGPIVDPGIPGYNFDIVGGADYSLDLARPLGSRVTTLTFKGRAVAPTDSFTLALNNYRQSGGGGYSMLKGAPVVYDKQQEIRQLLIDEVRSRQAIRPQDFFTGNWSLAYPGSPGLTGGPGAAVAGTTPASGGSRLRIISTNDFHGALESRADANGVQRGGAALVAAMIERARSECGAGCESILVDAGDMFQGTVISNLAYGRPVVDYYNRMGYDAAALGSHEFDWGKDTLRARMRQAKYPILGANVSLTDGSDAAWIPDDTMIVRGSIRVGIVGISRQQTATATMPSNVRGLRFDDPAPVIDVHARALRARGADVVIVLAHEGGFCNADATESCDGEIFTIASRITEKVDAIVSGHTHSLLDTYVGGIPIVQARSSGQAVAVLDIPLAGGKPAGRGVGEVRPVLATSVEPFAPVDSIVRLAAARVAALANRRVGTLSAPLTRSGDQYPLGNLVADANRWAGKGDIAIMNNGGIRAGLRAGPVTYGYLFEVQPFANTLYSIRMTGSQLREYLERLVADEGPEVHVSGVTIGYNPELPKGRRIVSLRLPAGRTLVDGASYNVIVNSFMATGGSNMGPPAGTSSKPLNVVDLDALVAYAQRLPSPIRAPEEARVFIIQ